MPSRDIFYSDNKSLPKAVMDKLPLLLVNNREGEGKISQYFGCRTLKDLSTRVLEEEINVNLDRQFIMPKTKNPSFKTKSKNKCIRNYLSVFASFILYGVLIHKIQSKGVYMYFNVFQCAIDKILMAGIRRE